MLLCTFVLDGVVHGLHQLLDHGLMILEPGQSRLLVGQGLTEGRLLGLAQAGVETRGGSGSGRERVFLPRLRGLLGPERVANVVAAHGCFVVVVGLSEEGEVEHRGFGGEALGEETATGRGGREGEGSRRDKKGLRLLGCN